MTPSGSAPNAASPSPLGRNTSSAPGATVVDVVVEDVVVVVEVVVDVGAAVVTGMVVDVVVGVAVVVVVSATRTEDVEPVSVAAGLSSLQPAIAAVRRNRGRRRVVFTSEVCHARCQLPDQGVGLMPTFNKLQRTRHHVDNRHRTVVEAADNQAIIPGCRADGGVDRDKVAEHDRIGLQRNEKSHDLV